MKKLFILLMVGVCFTLFSTSGWSLASLHAIDTILKGVNATGVNTFAGGTVSVLVVLTNPTSFQAHYGRFQYWGIDTATGLGIQLYGGGGTPGNTLDTTCFGVSGSGPNPPVSGQRTGTLVYAQGTVANYGGGLEFCIAPQDSTAFQVVGTGYGFATTLVPSVAQFDVFDQTLQTGGEFYQDRLVRINNLSLASTLPTLPTSGVGVNTFFTDYSGATVILYFTSEAVSMFAPTLGNPPSIITTGTFDIIGIATQYKASSPYTSAYEIYPRGYPSDFVSTKVSVSPVAGFTRPGGATISFTASGAMPPYTWSLSTTGLGTIDPASGVYTPPASSYGTVTAIATDFIGRTGKATVTLTTVSAPLVPEIESDNGVVLRENVKAAVKP